MPDFTFLSQNPKLEGTPLYDCIPQTGTCPVGCNQCYFNRPNAYYYPIDQLPLIPHPLVVSKNGGIVKMNCGHDSNIYQHKVIAAAEQYKHVFFNTSIPKLDFPGPVVFTANPKEERAAYYLDVIPDNLMFVRLRTSGTNLHWIDDAVCYYTAFDIPVVITMMAYYTESPPVVGDIGLHTEDCYVWQKRFINSYWCPTEAFKRVVMRRYQNNRSVSLCGTLTSNWCRDCRNCESYYWQTRKRLEL